MTFARYVLVSSLQLRFVIWGLLRPSHSHSRYRPHVHASYTVTVSLPLTTSALKLNTAYTRRSENSVDAAAKTKRTTCSAYTVVTLAGKNSAFEVISPRTFGESVQQKQWPSAGLELRTSGSKLVLIKGVGNRALGVCIAHNTVEYSIDS